MARMPLIGDVPIGINHLLMPGNVSVVAPACLSFLITHLMLVHAVESYYRYGFAMVLF